MPPIFPLHFQEAVLWILPKPFYFPYGTITLYGILFQETLSHKKVEIEVQKPHLHYITITDSV
jgi:hypothetical protein